MVIARRLAAMVPVLLIVTLVVFSLELLLPGDPAVTLAGENPTPEAVQRIRESLDLDRPLLARYGSWLADAVTGDLGESLFTRRPVLEEIRDRSAVTFSLMGGALVFGVVMGVPAGILAARFRRRFPDRAVTVLASLGVAIPHFLVGILLVIPLSLWWDLLPTAGYSPIGEDGVVEWARHLVIPVFALSGVLTAEVARQLRSSLAGVLEQDYIRTARAKGMRERRVLAVHGLRMAAAPAISVACVQVARLMGGAVVVETVFGLPGLGSLTVDSILLRDLPVIQGIVPFAVVIAVVMNLVADLAQMGLDPRVREAR